jgi:TolB-like protein
VGYNYPPQEEVLMRKVFTLALCTVFLAAVAAKDSLAILPFSGGDQEEGETIAELFSFEPDLVAVFNPVPRTSINRAIRSEQRFQPGSGMTDPDTAESLGKQVGAQYVVSGSITAVGKQKLLIIAILKIDDLRLIAGDIQTFTNIEEIQDKLPDMARNIVAAARKDASKLPRLVVTPVELSGGADAGTADALAQVLAAYIISNGGYAVYPRTASLEQIEVEYDTQLSRCTADDYLPDLGKGANPKLVLSVTARRLGNRNMFNAAIINLETGVQEAGASANYQTLEDGVSAVEQLAMSLSRRTVAPAAQTAVRILPNDLEAVFGVKGVSAAFNAVHTFLQTCNSGGETSRRERIGARIMLGDWIDLPHLTVQGDAGGGAINTDNIDLKEKGKLLRLIVVGIDSFAVTNKDAPAHIVFQFQNIPGTHRMNASDTNAGGYKMSELRQYLTGSFLRGLLAAGVPEGVLYAPTRYIVNGGSGATGADALADWLWLPTERELFENGTSYNYGIQWGPYSNGRWETAANQARLEYYDGNGQRTKYRVDGNSMWWWEASPSTYSTSAVFCVAGGNGVAGCAGPSSVGGFSPAFCVR